MPDLYWSGAGYQRKLTIEFTDGSFAILHSQECCIGMTTEAIGRVKDRRAFEVIRLIGRYSSKLSKEE